MAGLAVHQDLAALGAPSLDERHSTLVVFEFRFLVVLSTIAGVTHAKKRHLKKKQVTKENSVKLLAKQSLPFTWELNNTTRSYHSVSYGCTTLEGW